MTASGHEAQLPPPEPSARYQFGQGTFTGTRGNERDAPIAVMPHWRIGSARPIAVFRTLLGIPLFMTQSDFSASVR
jgi:hypothetical protein